MSRDNYYSYKKKQDALWYNRPDALEAVRALDNTKRDWNLSPLRTDFAINAGRVLNLGLMIGAIVAAPAALAWGTPMTIACISAGIAVKYLLYRQAQKGLESSGSLFKSAPPAVNALLENCYDRAGLDKSKFKLSVIPKNNRGALSHKDKRYIAGVAPNKEHFFVSEEMLETLKREELHAVFAHETGHVINNNKFRCGYSVTETGLSSGLYLMGVTSLLTLNFLSAGYFMGAAAASVLGRAYIKKLDEYRADRTSIYLTDEPMAMKNALNIIARKKRVISPEDDAKDDKKYDHPAVKALHILAKHPHVSQRNRYIDRVHSQKMALS